MRSFISELLRDSSRLPVVVLALVLVFAVVAVGLLTGTLVAARQIEDRVAFATTQTTPIAEDLDLVPLAASTADVAADIADELAPLGDQLEQVVTTAQAVDATAASVLASASDVQADAARIRADAESIAGAVGETEQLVGGIRGTAAAIATTAGDIEGRVDAIGLRFGDLVAVVESIGCGGGEANGTSPTSSLAEQRRRCGTSGVPGIVQRARTVVRLTDSIGDDTGDIAAQVGPTHGDKTLHGHANSIDCQLDGASCGR